jgi:hypothetical protein
MALLAALFEAIPSLSFALAASDGELNDATARIVNNDTVNFY